MLITLGSLAKLDCRTVTHNMVCRVYLLTDNNNNNNTPTLSKSLFLGTRPEFRVTNSTSSTVPFEYNYDELFLIHQGLAWLQKPM
jgi:hypothetical protein